MPIKLWVDDIRPPKYPDWIWAKTYDEAIYWLATDCVLEASLDHDLSIQHTLGYKDREKTGYDIVCWMEENNVWPKDGVTVHSMNPSGKFRMEQVIFRYYNTYYNT